MSDETDMMTVPSAGLQNKMMSNDITEELPGLPPVSETASEEKKTQKLPEGPLPGPTGKKILVFGLGSSGVKIVNSFMRLPGTEYIQTAVLDTDREVLGKSTAGTRIQAEAEWTVKSGLGCGGDIVKGERAVSRERPVLTKALAGYDYIIVTGGLGGGTATGGFRTLASVARSLAIPALFILTQPFSFESYNKRKNADDCIGELLQLTDALITLPNDLLFSTLPPDAGVEESFEMAAEEMAASVFGAAELLSSRKIFGGDFADIVALLRKKRTACAIGIGRASAEDGLDRCGMAIENMLGSPFLGGLNRLASAHTVVLAVTGGPDFNLAEMRQILDRMLALIPQNVTTSVGVTVNPAYTNLLQVSIFAINYHSQPEGAASWQDPSVSGVNSETGSGALPVEQGVLNLQSYSRGIFSGGPAVKYKNEDLDIPTFQRSGIKIDKGSEGKSEE